MQIYMDVYNIKELREALGIAYEIVRQSNDKEAREKRVKDKLWYIFHFLTLLAALSAPIETCAMEDKE